MSLGFAGSYVPPIPAIARSASADSYETTFWMDLQAFDPAATANPELWLCAISLWNLREGSSSGGQPDFPARPMSTALKGSSGINGSPHRTKAPPA